MVLAFELLQILNSLEPFHLLICIVHRTVLVTDKVTWQNREARSHYMYICILQENQLQSELLLYTSDKMYKKPTIL